MVDIGRTYAAPSLARFETSPAARICRISCKNCVSPNRFNVGHSVYNLSCYLTDSRRLGDRKATTSGRVSPYCSIAIISQMRSEIRTSFDYFHQICYHFAIDVVTRLRVFSLVPKPLFTQNPLIFG